MEFESKNSSHIAKHFSVQRYKIPFKLHYKENVQEFVSKKVKLNHVNRFTKHRVKRCTVLPPHIEHVRKYIPLIAYYPIYDYVTNIAIPFKLQAY